MRNKKLSIVKKKAEVHTRVKRNLTYISKDVCVPRPSKTGIPEIVPSATSLSGARFRRNRPWTLAFDSVLTRSAGIVNMKMMHRGAIVNIWCFSR